MIFAIAVTGIAWWAYFIKSHSVYKKGSAGFSDHALFAWFFTIFQIVAIEMFCGIVLKNLSSEMLGILSVVISGVVLFSARQGLSQVQGLARIKSSFLASKKNHGSRDRLLVYAILGSVLLSVVLSTVRIVVAPPNAFDTLTYHLPTSITWFQENKITLAEEVPVGRLNYAAKAPKLLNFWLLAFEKGNIELIEFSQYFGVILLTLSVYGILRRFGVGAKWRFVAASTVLFIPIVLIENYTLQDHVFLMAAHFAFLKFLYDFLDETFVSQKKAIFVVSCAAALLLAAKFSAPAHMIAVGAMLVLLYPKRMLQIVSKKSNVQVFLPALAVIALIGGVWYASNQLYYGSIFGPPQPQVARENKLLNNILEFPGRVTDGASQYNQDLVSISGFGVHVFGIGFVTALAALVFHRKNRQLWLLMGSSTILLLMYFSLYYTPYNYRLFIFLPISILIAGFYFIDKSKSAILQRLVLILVPIGMIFSLVTTVYSDYFREPFLVFRNITQLYPDDRTSVMFDYSADKFNRDPSFLFIGQYIPVDEKILYVTQSEEGYDDLVIAGYYDNNLRRETIWGGELDESKYFTTEGKPTRELETYMKANQISFIHNNVVFFNQTDIPMQMEQFEDGEVTPFIKITENLYYLPRDLR